jgi:hypothetical protein
MFFKFGLGENARTNKNLDVSHTKRAHTHTPGLLTHVKKKREREGDEVHINSKNAPSALERHRSQI